MKRLLADRFLWYLVVIVVFIGAFAYASEIKALIGIPTQDNWELDYYTAFKRFLFIMSVGIASWRFGAKGGLVTCSVFGVIILPLIMTRLAEPSIWLDSGILLVGIMISILIGKQGDMKRLLEKNTRELKRKAVEMDREIAERKRVEERIKHAAEEWRATFDSITDFISINSRDNKILRVNKAFAEEYGMKPEETIGKHCYEIIYKTKKPCQDCPHKKTLETKKTETLEVYNPEREMYYQISTSPMFDNSGEVMGSVHIIRDITKRRQMEEQLIMTDRLASIGELASGIAHELNNPLTSVIGFSQLLMEEDFPDTAKKDLEIVHNEARRASGIVKNLLMFARKHSPVKQVSQINKIIDDVLKLRSYEQRVNNIEVTTNFAPKLPEIMVDYFQIQQVFLNIIINAESAMLESNKCGKLTITTERKNDHVVASFKDDGPGIDEDNIDRIFHPFFTTKEVGKGTGLGLSICHGIVTEHKGKIYVKSELGRGANFVIELPINDHNGDSQDSTEIS